MFDLIQRKQQEFHLKRISKTLRKWSWITFLVICALILMLVAFFLGAHHVLGDIDIRNKLTNKL